MRTVVAVFGSSSAAERAAGNLVNAGVPRERIRQLTPSSSDSEIHSAVPTSETEQAGIGKAIGGLVGAAVGVTAALGTQSILGGSLASVTASSLLWIALAGAILAVVGGYLGNALEEKLSQGLPKDEIYFYEESLRRGRSVVFVIASSARQERIARRILGQAGAASLDPGDEEWRIGLEVPDGMHRTRRTG
jgi:hypothetical protein